MAKNPPAQNQSETSNKLGRPNVLSVLISSLLDFFILGACVGETIGQAKNPPAQNQSETSKIRPPQFALGSHQFLIRFLHCGGLRGGDHRTGQDKLPAWLVAWRIFSLFLVCFHCKMLYKTKKRHDQSYLTFDEIHCTRIKNELSSWLPGSLSGVIFCCLSLVVIGKIK